MCDRYLRPSTLEVLNRPPQDWYAVCADPVLPEGALDRLVDFSYHLVTNGPSYRPRKRPGQKCPPTTTPFKNKMTLQWELAVG